MNLDPRTETNLATLTPAAQKLARLFVEKCNAALKSRGYVAKIISGTRSYAEQNRLYSIGRSKPGRKVTNARGGYSNHNFGIAFDIGIFNGTSYISESPIYTELGMIGESVGLEWGGRWTSFKDEPHYQLKTGFTLAQLRERVAAGKPIA